MTCPAANQEPTFTTTDTKLYTHIVTLWNPDNTKLLKQPESSFKKTINWNKYQSKVTEQAQNRYLETVSKFSRSKQTVCFIIWK